MPSQLYAQTKNSGKKISAFSTATDRRMFQSRPFVVQKQGEEKSREQPDLKTSLMRAERYGHNLYKTNHARLSDPQAVQQKAGIERSVLSERLNSQKRQQAKQTVEALEGNKYEKEADPVEVEDVVSPPTSQVQGLIQTKAYRGETIQMARSGGRTPRARGTPFSKNLRERMIAANRRQNNGYITCENGKCGFQHQKTSYFFKNGRLAGDGSFHIDHVHPKSKGGRGTVNNGRVLCGTCNTSRGNRRRIRRTGMMKFPGLHGKTKPHRMTKSDYDPKIKDWRKSSTPMIP
ncbi:HNH endonuclease [Nostoc sp.]|uniref:HNH endonuclease n=1 Tax=Nostoc sp. TaxID=1180 RepID=UPI002FF8F28F